MAAITRAQQLKELLPGLHALFGQEYNTYDKEHEEIFERNTSDRSFEEETALSLFGTAPEKGEGQSIAFDTAQESYTQRYDHRTIALGFAITEEAMEDNLYGSLSARYTKALARSMNYTKQVRAARILNEGFTTYNTGDGVSLFNTAHPQVYGGTVSNRPATGADLNETSLEAAIIQIAGWTDERGLLVEAKEKKLIVPRQLQFTATRILQSDLRIATADNDVNAIKQMGSVPEGYRVNHYLTDPNAWFLKTDVMDGFKYFQRIKMQKGMDGDFDTGNVRYKSRERYSFGVSNYRGGWGSPGA